jgi:FKBP-type peptidyl-prolyl cis-trans isomerase SlyD
MQTFITSKRNVCMNIQKDTVVTMLYAVADEHGKVIEQAKEPTAYLHGGYGNTLAKIEEALQDQTTGFKTTITLQPEDAFGLRDEALVQTIAKKDFPPGVKVGGQLQGRGNDGTEHVFTVTKIKGDTVFLDGNHPWAGKTLRFSLQVKEVRAASAEEIAHGHAHGAHGHHH